MKKQLFPLILFVLTLLSSAAYGKEGCCCTSCLCPQGPQGSQGPQGVQGPAGLSGTGGSQGIRGAQGAQGIQGTQGAQGIPCTSGIGDFADFYALMPGDNNATVAPGASVDFPQNGPSSGTGLIARTGADTFNLTNIGIYQVFFQVSVSEAGQLVITLDSGSGGMEIPYTVVGRATGTGQLVGTALVQTTSVDSILSVSNPAGNSTALTITPLAGGFDSVSAHLIITQIQ